MVVGDDWLILDKEGHVIRMSEQGWKHIHGIEDVPGQMPRVVRPALPEIDWGD